MTGNNLKNPPKPGEIEVSVFGPGVGESILVHCGNGEWLAVDSALDEKGVPWPLSYLCGLGFDPAKALKLIVCTHWHTDHVRGLTDLVGACPAAKFVCSSAFLTSEFQEIVARYSGVTALGKISPPLSELRGVFEILAARRATAGSLPPVSAKADLLLRKFPYLGAEIDVFALSPSHDDDLRARVQFAQMNAPLEDSAAGISPITPNKASIVLHISTPAGSILLGGDLETTGSHLTGWDAVIRSAVNPARCLIFKVPHHGSENAYSSDVWQHLLLADTNAIVTPYSRSGLPRTDDLLRLRTHTNSVFVTSVSQRARTAHRRPEVERTIREAVSNYSAVRTQVAGLVRLRRSQADIAWRHELFGAAQAV